MTSDVEKVAKKVLDALRSQPLVRFSCVPGGAFPGERVKLTAVFYLPSSFLNSSSLSKLKPVARAADIELEVPLQPVATSSPSTLAFEGSLELPSTTVSQDGSLTLALSPAAGARSLATATLYILSRQ